MPVANNWGRWGPDDERGSLNLVGPDATLAAARSIRSGTVYNLGLPVKREGVPYYDFRGAPHRLPLTDPSDRPLFESYGAPEGSGSVEDVLIIASHNGTHMDALAHVFAD